MADHELNTADASAALSKVFAKKLRALQPPRVPEKVEQAHGVQLLRSIGGKVYVLGGHRRKGDYQGTMQTEGIADVFAFIPVRGERRWVFLAWECKAYGGRMRPEQREFEALCTDAGITHIAGPFDVLIEWLAARGFVKADQFPHYRQPQGAQK